MILFRVFILIALWLPLAAVCTWKEEYDRNDLFFSLDEVVDTDANKRTLSELHVPFRVQVTSEIDLEALAALLLFIDNKRGVCPHVDAWELLREVFQLSPTLGEKYGEQRLRALQSLIKSSNPMAMGNLGANEPLGLIEMESSADVGVVLIHLGDILVHRDANRRVILRVNITQPILRRVMRRRLKVTGAYVGKLNTIHVTLRRIHHSAMINEREERLKVHKQYQKHLSMMHELEELKRGLRERPTIGDRLVVALDSESHDPGAFPFADSSTSTRCSNILHAIETLRSQKVLPTERRMRSLIVAREEACGKNIPESFGFPSLKGEKEEAVDEGVCDFRCPRYCEGVKELQNWTTLTGFPISSAQLHALYHSILVMEDGANYTTGHYLSRIRQLAVDDVDRGVFSTCFGLCSTFADLHSEKKFLAGLLELLDESDVNANDESSKSGKEAEASAAEVSQTWWHRAQKGYLFIWEAAHAGSKSAIAAFATMKEHGILSSSQPQVAVELLHAMLSERNSYFWRQVMGTKIGNSSRTPPSAEKLLQYERFFALENSWSLVNEPYITRERLNNLDVELDAAGDDRAKEFESQGQLSPDMVRDIFMAQLYIAGIKDFSRDLPRAECLLLTVLRKLQYTCDVSHAEDDKLQFSEGGRGGGCDKHLEQLHLLRRSGVIIGQCSSYKLEVGAGHHSRFPRMMQSQGIHGAVHDVLVLLSYVQLLNGLKYSLAAKYAFLALELSAAAFHYSLAKLGEDAEKKFHAASSSKNIDTSLLKDEGWSVEAFFIHVLQRGNPVDHFSDFTRSGFVSSESLVLLAMSTLRSGLEGEQYMRIALERFFGARPCTDEEGRATCRVQRTFFLLREAARLWKDEDNKPGILDRRYSSPRRVDSFFLMISLLRGGHITVADIRDGDLFSSPRYAPDVSHFFRPSVSDTCASFIGKLLQLARNVSPIATSRHRAQVNDKSWHIFATSVHSSRELQVLRAAVQNSLHEHNINPLLVTSDIHYYLDDTRWTRLQRLFSGVWEAILFLFSQTTTESLEEQLATKILPKNRPNSIPARIAELLAESVLSSSRIREATIALQLLSTALMSGEPDGFSLMLIEERERGNVHLRSFTQFLSEHLWGRSLYKFWMEEHKTAQWHHTKPLTQGGKALFTINHRHVFRYAMLESKMELFTQIALKRVMNRQRLIASRSPIISKEAGKEIVHTLALCSGVLIDLALRRGRPFLPHNTYDGMYLPVGSPLCLQGLLQHVRSTGVSPFWGLSAKSLELQLLGLLVNLTTIQSLYYDIPLTEKEHPVTEAHERKKQEAGGRIRKRLVEPWRRSSEFEDDELYLPQLGEGMYYNSRLHRVTGTYYAARIWILFIRIRKWLGSIVGFKR